MTKSLAFDKVQWGALASLGLAIPVMLLFARLNVCPPLGLQPFALLPLSGTVKGFDPHLFIRIMHNLTHPILLLCYAVVLTYVTSMSVDRPLNVKTNQVLFCGLVLLHLCWLVSHCITLFLPMRCMIQEVGAG